MRKRFLTFPILGSVAVPTNTGGQQMAARIGAKLANMDRVFGMPHFVPEDQDATALVKEWGLFSRPSYADWAKWRGLPVAVVVNKKGRRIGDESQVYSVFNHAFGTYDIGTCELVNLPAYFICDAGYLANYTMPMMTEIGEEIPGYPTRADTLEELAQKLGINPEGLADDATFNENARNGVDPVWHRGERAISLQSFNTAPNSLNTQEREGLANPLLAPLETGPFYGCAYVSGSCNTSGVVTDGNAQVLNVDDEPIAGLYACGIAAGAYVHGGTPVGQGITMGWVGMRHALGLSD